jgi:uncharacterized protein YuzE
MKALEAAKRIRYSPDSDVLYFLLAEGEEEYFEEPIRGFISSTMRAAT